jgi:hypothetical protein
MTTANANPNYHGTLVGSAVDTITLLTNPAVVEIVNVSGATAIYYTVDGSAPTVGGVNTRVVPAAAGARDRVNISPDATGVVKLISSGTPTYSVEPVAGPF